jgi:predicted RNA binding protein YcfA (HicA-like mRNA interferase family)
LISLLQKDGWQRGRKATHGITLTKATEIRILVTFVPDKKVSLPEGTLQAILGSKQTQLGKSGLLKLLNLYGID